MARILIFTGIAIVITGLILMFFPNAFKWVGRLPGDIHIKRDNFTFSFPLVTMLLISVLISIIIQIIRRL